MTISDEVGGREARVLVDSPVVPVCRIEDVFGSREELSDEDRAKLTEYLSSFQRPKLDGSGDPLCPKCGSYLLSSFRWGLAHGEGFCGGKKCGWPVRYYHFIDGPRLDRLLAYHPRHVTKA